MRLRDLGRALAQRLADEGCSVLLADMSEEKALAAAEKIGKGAMGVRADVTSPSDCAAMVERAVAEFGKLDILIANAGILIAGDVCEFDPDKWRKVIEVNLNGYFISGAGGM